MIDFAPYFYAVKNIDRTKSYDAAILHIVEEFDEVIQAYNTLRQYLSDQDRTTPLTRLQKSTANKMSMNLCNEFADVVNLIIAFYSRLGLESHEILSILLAKTAHRNASLKFRGEWKGRDGVLVDKGRPTRTTE